MPKAGGKTQKVGRKIKKQKENKTEEITRINKELSQMPGGVFGANSDMVRGEVPSSDGNLGTPQPDAANRLPVPHHSASDAAGDIQTFLRNLHLDHLLARFQKHAITLEMLLELELDDLDKVGITEFGYKRKIAQEITKMNASARPYTVELIPLQLDDRDYMFVDSYMQSSIREHDDFNFKEYNILKVEEIRNDRLWQRYQLQKDVILEENNGKSNEKLLFHGCPQARTVAEKGFDMRVTSAACLFGAGHYFADLSSKANQYVFGEIGTRCHLHKEICCYLCDRQLLLNRVLLGKSENRTQPDNGRAHAPEKCHSIVGIPSARGLTYKEYCVYKEEQIYPQYLITFRMVDPEAKVDDSTV